MASRIHIPDSVLDEIITEWEAAPHTMKRSVLDAHAALIGCSTDTLYRRIRRRQGRSKTVEREPAYDAEIIKEAFYMKERARAAGLGEHELSTERCREKLIRRGVPEAEVPSVSTINRRGREMGIAAAGRVRRVETQFALQQLQCDWSRSKFFQLHGYDETRRDYIVRSEGRHLAYKEHGQAHRTWIIAVKDSYSRLRYARMFAASGENYMTTLAFLGLAWDAELAEAEGRAFCHPPLEAFQMDRGSTMKHRSFKEAIRALGAEPVEAQAKEAQGKIENQFRWLWAQFEADLHEELGRGETLLMQDYNALLVDYLVREGKEKAHPVNKRLTREQVYLASLRMHPPKTFDVSLFRLAFTPVERTVNAYGCISLDKIDYQVPEHARDTQGRKIRIDRGTKIQVLKNADGEVMGRLLDQHAKEFRLTPWEQPAFGDFSHGPASTLRERIARQVDIKRPGPEATRERLGLDAPGGGDASPVRTLPTEPISARPDSPFYAEPDAPLLLAEAEARAYVGRQLSAHNLTYADAAFIFDPVLGQATREHLDRILTAYLTHRQAI